MQVLTGVKVGLRLVGAPQGFASEMVVMLTKDLAATSVLLNRVGVGVGGGTGGLIGHGYDGWDVVFADGAAGGDVHARSLVSGVMTGEVEPDGRVDPLDGTRPGMLSVMNGMGGNGSWVLSVADLEVGGRMRLEGWSLTLKGWTAVPEPGEWGMAAGLALAGLGAWRRWQGRKAV